MERAKLDEGGDVVQRKSAQDPLDEDEIESVLRFAYREQLAERDSEMCLRGERIQRLVVEVRRWRKEHDEAHRRFVAACMSGGVP